MKLKRKHTNRRASAPRFPYLPKLWMSGRCRTITNQLSNKFATIR